jgi:hypothetical protein
VRWEHPGTQVLPSVQVAPLERYAGLLVMRRSGVRFPKAAQLKGLISLVCSIIVARLALPRTRHSASLPDGRRSRRVTAGILQDVTSQPDPVCQVSPTVLFCNRPVLRPALPSPRRVLDSASAARRHWRSRPGPADDGWVDEVIGRTPAISAHRGGGGNAHAETYEAYRSALEAGAEYVEIDVRQSSSHVCPARSWVC